MPNPQVHVHDGLTLGPVPVEGIEPRKGWTLCSYVEIIGASTRETWFWAVGHGERRLLDVSSHNFTPTQARWNWLVDWDFPSALAHGGKGGPLNDTLIDNAIARTVDLRVLERGAKAFAEMQGRAA